MPSGWAVCRLYQIAEQSGGYAFKSNDYSKSGYRVIRISDFNDKNFINENIIYHPYDLSLEKFIIQEEDILIAMTGGTVGKSLLVRKITEPMLLNQRVARIKTCCNVDYIYNVIISESIKNKIKNIKNSTNDNISSQDINNFLIPLPPLAEQQRIVQKIKEIFTLIEKVEESLL